MPNVGDILNGTVVKVLRSGAIVRFKSGETGFLHISEISSTYIRNIFEYLQTGKEVKVKVISKNPKENKMSLSIRKVNEEEDKKIRFEASLNKFLKESGEKQKQLQKSLDSKRGVKRNKKV